MINWQNDPPRLLADEQDFGRVAEHMVQSQLAARGIADPRVLRAMRCAPRHAFLGPALFRRAYDDCALASLNNQTISQPYMVAVMTELLDVQPGMSVLEVGTGTGYQTLILAMLALPDGRVTSIERDDDLADLARANLDRFNADNVTVLVGDGTLGAPDAGPFDRVLVTAAAPDAPRALLDQLAAPGRMVIPVGDRDSQSLITIDKRDDGTFRRAMSTPCRFVPLIGEQGWDA
ncbi:MAG: protein-L-isoaspartate(D-aspartate) O-methyltransferase [Phycisphaera sp.]|nr:protein-L-isoaspartate(D-aspartate) O-methyltransferase [Phycisphaera sp.]